MEINNEDPKIAIDRDIIRKELAQIVSQIQFKSLRANILADNLRKLVLYCDCNQVNEFLFFIVRNNLVRVCNYCGRINILYTIEKEENPILDDHIDI